MDPPKRWFLRLGYIATRNRYQSISPARYRRESCICAWDRFYADGFGSWQMRLSYCHPTPERIRQGVKALAGVVKEEIDRRSNETPKLTVR